MRKIIIPIIAMALAACVITPAVANVSGQKAEKPDKFKPVSATNVKLFKKISLKGSVNTKGNPSHTFRSATGYLGAPFAETTDKNRYAVVVGISNYPGTAYDLNYADDDAREMNSALIDKYKYNASNVTLLTDLAATRAAILTAIDSIPANAGEVVFFFSGHGSHGVADDGDTEYLDQSIVAHDGTNLVDIWDGELKQHFAKFSPGTHIVFIFDSCLSGGMKDDLDGSNRVIAMACGETEFSYEGPQWHNGEFSYYYVDKGILQGYANTHDYDKDGILRESNNVTAEEAFDYALSKCRQDNPLQSDGYLDDLLF